MAQVPLCLLRGIWRPALVLTQLADLGLEGVYQIVCNVVVAERNKDMQSFKEGNFVGLFLVDICQSLSPLAFVTWPGSPQRTERQQWDGSQSCWWEEEKNRSHIFFVLHDTCRRERRPSRLRPGV